MPGNIDWQPAISASKECGAAPIDRSALLTVSDSSQKSAYDDASLRLKLLSSASAMLLMSIGFGLFYGAKAVPSVKTLRLTMLDVQPNVKSNSGVNGDALGENLRKPSL